MKKVIFPIVIIAVLFLVGKFLFSNHEKGILASKNLKKENIAYKNIKISDSIIKAEIAASEENKKRGLSGRESLVETAGMLFVFDKSGFYPFWMKEMNFSIDIVWIGDNWEIIGVAENLNPDSYPQTFYPPKPARLALEVNAGWAKKNNVKIGMTASVLNSE